MTARTPPKAVLDTNILVSGLLTPRGAPRVVLDLIRDRTAHLVLTLSLLKEYEEVVQRQWLVDRCSVDGVDPVAFLSSLLNEALPVQPAKRLPVQVHDPKDAMVLAAALGGQADFLVTGDDDLLSLAGDPRLAGLRILSPPAFVEALGQACG